jgi:hypothetical protein
MTDTNDTIDGLLAEFRGYAAGMPPSYHVAMSWMSWHDFRMMLDRFEAAHKRERERGNAAKLRERRLLMSCARWILCHDIYGHTAKELLAECKEVLNDDGQFLFKEDEQ